MPEAYFRVVAPEVQQRHLHAIAALGSSKVSVPKLMLADEEQYTFLRQGQQVAAGSTEPSCSIEAVSRDLESLPADAALRRILLFSSKDGRLQLNLFETGDGSGEALYGTSAAGSARHAEEAVMRAQLSAYAAELRRGTFVGTAGHTPPSTTIDEPQLEEFLRNCPSRYVVDHVPRLLYTQLALYKTVVGTEAVALELEHNFRADGEAASFSSAEPETLITAAFAAVEPREALQRGLKILEMQGLTIRRAYADQIGAPESDAGVTVLRFVAFPAAGSPPATQTMWDNVANGLKRLKWLDGTTLALASAAGPQLGLQNAEVAMALADLSLSCLDHPLLGRSAIHKYLHDVEMLPHVSALSNIFLDRFDPAAPLDQAAFASAMETWEKAIETATGNEQKRQLLRTMGSACRHTLRTNAFVNERHALALRLEPLFFESVLPKSVLNNVPFGVFFVAGRQLNGYHVRFRDVSRGGMRMVLPPSAEAYSAESRRHFFECFSLAWAQQLKNKDIPEGGSKAVVLVRPNPAEDRAHLLHSCVKRFTDSLLDLITPEPEVRARIVGSLPAESPEHLYLGPDENITPADINWVVAHAAVRGYPLANAFMSSKPAAGINHKEYGVTSEGVAVFLDSGLRALGIEPKTQPWSVKITGGPDGDVAGNMLRILDREYGSMVRVVAMADGSGCAEDPSGLPMAELLRLFELGAPLEGLDRSTLSAQGQLTLADTPEGIAARNSMHARVVADAFVPAGGRPSTLNKSNYREMIMDGAATTKIIVEGANLFCTADARQGLFDAVSLPIVKDSSANKCGVICSSLEIASAMLISPEEFAPIKPIYVSQVLQRLRELARLEADLLFAEGKQSSQPLPLISDRISVSILRVSDALATELDRYDAERRGRLWPLMKEQLPEILFEKYSARLPTLPWEYVKSLISSGLAGRLVYREGLSFVESLGDAQLPAFALEYLQQEQRVRALAAEVRSAGLKNSDAVSELLVKGGVRVATVTASSSRSGGGTV